jgi:heat shock protein HtpX
MTITVVLVGIIMLIAQTLMHIRPRSNNDNNQAAMIFLVLGIALAILSPLIAELIKLAISRTREYLADADGALLTRYPEGLARALQKIEAAQTMQPLRSANQATAHLFIANPFGATGKKWFANAFSTHPPTAERISRLMQMGS